MCGVAKIIKEAAVSIYMALLLELEIRWGRALPTQHPAGNGSATPWARDRGCNGGTGNGSFAKRSAATRANKLMEFAGGQNQQQSLAHRLRDAAFWAIEFACGKISKLLRHIARVMRDA